jgi:hypothetical protein
MEIIPSKLFNLKITKMPLAESDAAATVNY